MLLSQSFSRNVTMLFTAILTTGLLFTASAGQARSKTVVYNAELAAPVETSRHIIRGTVISCSESQCKGAKSSSSIKTICAKLSRKVGPLTSFSYKGKPIDDAALAKCNG